MITAVVIYIEYCRYRAHSSYCI